jgi:hypothetical protein
MISPIAIIIYAILAVFVYVVQMLLLRKSENKIIHSLPLFAMITALLVAYIMSVVDVKGEVVKCGTLMPAVRIIKDAVTVCMVTDAAAMVINKAKKK